MNKKNIIELVFATLIFAMIETAFVMLFTPLATTFYTGLILTIAPTLIYFDIKINEKIAQRQVTICILGILIATGAILLIIAGAIQFGPPLLDTLSEWWKNITLLAITIYTFWTSLATIVISIPTLVAAGIYIPQKVNPYAFWTLLASLATAAITGTLWTILNLFTN